MATKRDFTSITVRYNVYESIKNIVKLSGRSISEFIEDLVKQYEDTSKLIGVLDRALASGVRPVEVDWGKIWTEKGVLPYEEIFNDPEIKFYKSAAWIRTKDYPKKAGGVQWPVSLQERLRSDEMFRFEKMLVVSPRAWDQDEVWEWIFKWITIRSEHRNRVDVFLIKEEDAMKIAKESVFLDIGVYGEKVLGLLEVDEESMPGNYKWNLVLEKIDHANSVFEKMKNSAMDMSKTIHKLAKSVRQDLISEEKAQRGS